MLSGRGKENDLRKVRINYIIIDEQIFVLRKSPDLFSVPQQRRQADEKILEL